MLVVISLLFSKLGIPNEALAMSTAFYIIVDYVLTSFKAGNIMLGVFETSDILGNVDRTKFEKKKDEAQPAEAA